MSKIIQVINTMIEHPEHIQNVVALDSRHLIFRYWGRCWSIDRINQGSYILYFYPEHSEPNVVRGLLDIPNEELTIKSIDYSTEYYFSREAVRSFHELYEVVTSKLHNLDFIFDQILALGKN